MSKSAEYTEDDFDRGIALIMRMRGIRSAEHCAKMIAKALAAERKRNREATP